MGFIVKSDAFSTNIQRINFVLELAEAQFNMYSGYIAGVLPKNASTKEETTNTNREEDKTIMRLHYLDDKNFAFIADYLGYSESWIKKRHLRILRKVTKLL